MIISDSGKFIFMHINMTGGTTIDFALKSRYDHWPVLAERLSYTGDKNPYQGRVKLPGRGRMAYLDCLTYPELLQVSDEYEKLIRDYFVFSFVRNPYDWHYSFYQKQRKGGRTQATFADFDQTWPAQIRHLPPLEHVDFLGRTDDFENSLVKLQKHLDLGDIDFIPKNVSSSTKPGYRYLDNFTSKTIAYVNRIYGEDFEELGFEMLDPAGFPDATLAPSDPH